MRDEPLTIRTSEQGPLVIDRPSAAVALRVAALDRPRLFEQFWKMGLARNFAQFQAAVRMEQLPLFNTAYADRDGHIMYLYNAAVPIRPRGDYRFWGGIVPGDESDLIWDPAKIVRYDQLPQVIDPPSGWVQNSNDALGHRLTRCSWIRLSFHPIWLAKWASPRVLSAAFARFRLQRS
jgi:acyl-homoserine-lactone acylase